MCLENAGDKSVVLDPFHRSAALSHLHRFTHKRRVTAQHRIKPPPIQPHNQPQHIHFVDLVANALPHSLHPHSQPN
ncbi:hypothetical protein IAQ61_011992 [Plenodomus lingam]|uniref:uncharacterized protein n=1 Tax=Leptosphaeria maculans TaxID=5022 RepID=UPI00331E29E3|nr:hypothetical protein IAQ61_011992 [Plenodomus lingam]